MQLSDAQLLTACIAVILPLSMLLYSNSRITPWAEMATLAAEMQTLRVEMQASRAEIRAAIQALSLKIDKALEKHVLEYHSRGK